MVAETLLFVHAGLLAFLKSEESWVPEERPLVTNQLCRMLRQIKADF